MKGFIIAIHILSFRVCAGAGYGEPCISTQDCTDTGQVCANGKCACLTNNYYSYDGRKCVKELGRDCSTTSDCNDAAVVCDTVCKCSTATHYDNNGVALGGLCTARHGLDETCTNPAVGAGDDQCSTTNALCKADTGGSFTTYTCQCGGGFVQDGSSCVIVKILGDQCTSTSQCNYQYAECKSISGTMRCDCQDVYYNDGSTCSKRDIGETCDSVSQCSDTNTICSSTCQCKDGYYDTTGDGNIGGQCYAKRDLGETCDRVSQCSDTNTICSSTCQCEAGYYDTTGAGDVGGECNAKKNLGVICTRTEECATSNTECPAAGTRTCSCLSNYFQVGGNTCEKRDLGETCERVSQCSDTNTICSSTCQCKDGYYDTTGDGNIGGQCNTKRDLGETCDSVSQCSDTNTICSSTCQCKAVYYDTNGDGNIGGQCNARHGLDETCTNPAVGAGDDQCSTTNALCKADTGGSFTTYTCQCGGGFVQDGSSCVIVKILGDQCTSTSQCNYQYAECKSISGTMRCDCQDVYYNDGSTCSKRDIGETCDSVSQCSDTNTICSSTCQCKDGYYDTTGDGNIGGQCYAKRDLGETCDRVSQCSDTNTICSSTCQCEAGYYDTTGAGDVGGECNAKKNLGVICTRTEECATSNTECPAAGTRTCSCLSNYFQVGGNTCEKRDLGETCERVSQCSDTNTICSSTCQCKDGYYDTTGDGNIGGQCNTKRDLGETCDSVSQCSDTNTICSSTCQCKAVYYDTTGDGNIGGQCNARHGLDETCTNPAVGAGDDQCSTTNALCKADTGGSFTTYTCQCGGGFVQDGSSCVIVKILGDQCTSTSQCNYQYAECKSISGTMRCDCQDVYYNDGSTCSKRDIGETCDSVSQCSDTNTICSSTCQCKDGYYDTTGDGNIGGQCYAKRDLGETCDRVSQCSDTNTICSSTCQCEAGYYDTTGAGDVGGECNAKRDLGETCERVSQCSDTNTICSSTCQCKDGYYDTTGDGNIGGQCNTKRDLGETCDSVSQCSDTNTICSSTCQCKAVYYDTTGDGNIGGQCNARHGLDETCTSPAVGAGDDQCTTSNAVCKANTGSSPTTYSCQCGSGFFSDGTACVTGPVKYLDDSCTANFQCAVVTNSECVNSKCQCLNGYYQSGTGSTGTCTKRYLDQSCNANYQCSLVTNGECRSSKCLCKSGYYQTGTGSEGTCTKRYLDQSCNANSQCSLVTNGECRNSKCLCRSGYYQTGTGSTGTCTKRQLGQTCLLTNQCSAGNAVCSGTCQCQSEYYDSNGSGIGGSCNARAAVGSTCPQPTGSVPNTATCLDYNARCMENGSSYTCQCISTYYDSLESTNRNCIIRKDLGVACSTPVNNLDQCSDPSASCRRDSNSSPYKCTCNTGYHQESTGCVANKALGESCDPTSQEVECSDPAALCLGSKCTCNSNHYDSNGLANNGVCSPITNLKATNVGFTSIQTSQMTVTWTAPEIYKVYITRFTVQWKPTSSSNSIGESENRASYSTTLRLTRGIDPGRAYTVTITSTNEQTQQGSPRSTSVVRYQAAKPGITGGIDWSNSDKDTSGGTIKVSWSAPLGYINSYNVKLIDGTTESSPSSLSSAGRYATFQSSGLKNGYRYTVTIQALSETYSNGQTVSGNIYTAVFKTTPKTPGPPQNGLCKDPTDNSITLNWTAPSVPNGDLVGYHIHVYSYSGSFLFNVSTSGTESVKTVGTLAPGTNYRFRIYAENEQYQSSSYACVSSNCKTNAKMSTPPTNLQITDVTRRSFTISWEKPENTFSEENYGYVRKITDGQDNCLTEKIYRCSDCIGGFLTSNLRGSCDSAVRTMIDKTKEELNSQMTYSASLNPDVAYSVTVTAINDAGRGYPANKTERTKEEVPQIPYSVTVSSIETTSFKVSWNIDRPRPGKTFFTISLAADPPAANKEFMTTGFDTREYLAQGLQEYWNYSVTVTASTSVGDKTSDRTQEYTTLPAAPGKVDDLKITEALGGIYTLLQISWRAPAILLRNSVIKEYSLVTNSTGMTTKKQSLSHESFEDHEYTTVVNVIPEETYTFQVYAINVQGMKGEVTTIEKQAPAGVPVNIEDTLHIDIISLHRLITVGERQFTVTLVQDFFEETTNGQVQVSGIIACAKDCEFGGIKTLLEFNTMDNWQQASQHSFTLYRVTNPTWLDEVKMQCSCNRRKRAVTNVEYTLGSEDCTDVSPEEYCNGPLDPGTSYNLVAVTCTNGGCLLSRQYGPFVTASEDVKTTTVECDFSAHSIIIGVVLGLIILILLVYAGYTTFLIRRYRQNGGQEVNTARKNDRKSQTYVNESFVVGGVDAGNSTHAGTFSNIAPPGESDTEYSRLDDNTREDKSTYEIIQSSHGQY